MTGRPAFPRGVWPLGLWLAVACSDAPTAPPAGFAPPSSSTTLALAPGEFVTLRGQQAVDPIELPPAAETRTYLVAVQNASAVPGSERAVRVSVQGITPFAASGARARAGRLAAARTGARGDGEPLERWYEDGEARFRGVVSRAVAGATARTAARRPMPAVGQTIEFRSPVETDGTLRACESTASVTGVVRAVGTRFALVEDTMVAGSLTAADYARFLAEIEQTVVPVSETYFGAPYDVDGNGVVIALLSAAVNRLGAAGFFTASDLAAVEDCPTSNEGEILWLTGPDAAGRHGEPVPVDLVRDRLVGIVAHELQHLIHAQRRVFEAGGDLASPDELWLNEGLSHIAEEVTGFYAAGLRTGANYAYEDLDRPEVSARFRTYHLGVFRFVRDYLLDTSDVPAIIDGPISRSDLSRARGFGYLFLRWVADRYGAAGPPGLVASELEEAFFRELVVGGAGLYRSTENVERAVETVFGVSRPWRELFARYAAAPAVDDVTAAGVELAAELRIESWNLPAVFANARDRGFGLHFPDGFPLSPPLLILPDLPSDGFDARIDLRPSTAAYFRLESPHQTPRTRLRLLGIDLSPLVPDEAIQITIVRTF